MIYCVWYPSGGFGHFINAVLSLHGVNFKRPNNYVAFSDTGDSHSLELTLPKYFHDQKYPEIKVNDQLNYSVLIDNGINNCSKNFLKTFNNSKVIKLCYDDVSWPIVAKTSIIKASKSSLRQELPVDEQWPCQELWAIREKYYLYLKEHSLRSAWKDDANCFNLDVLKLWSYQELKTVLSNIVDLTDFESMHQAWAVANNNYFFPIIESIKLIESIKTQANVSLGHITDIWDQAVINYVLNVKFGIDIPVNDYPDWFQSTDQIFKLLK